MKRLPLLLASALALCTATLVRADAPAGQYLPFDGNVPTVTDAFTTLTWDRAVVGPAAYLGAQGMCPYPSRLPTLKELLTIVDESPHNYESQNGAYPYRYVDGSAFHGTPIDKAFWTLTPSVKNSFGAASKAFTVDFGTGGVVEQDTTSQFYVRCVR